MYGLKIRTHDLFQTASFNIILGTLITTNCPNFSITFFCSFFYFSSREDHGEKNIFWIIYWGNAFFSCAVKNAKFRRHTHKENCTCSSESILRIYFFGLEQGWTTYGPMMPVVWTADTCCPVRWRLLSGPRISLFNIGSLFSI